MVQEAQISCPFPMIQPRPQSASSLWQQYTTLSILILMLLFDWNQFLFHSWLLIMDQCPHLLIIQCTFSLFDFWFIVYLLVYQLHYLITIRAFPAAFQILTLFWRSSFLNRHQLLFGALRTEVLQAISRLIGQTIAGGRHLIPGLISIAGLIYDVFSFEQGAQLAVESLIHQVLLLQVLFMV